MFYHTTYYTTLHGLGVLAEMSLSVPSFQRMCYVMIHLVHIRQLNGVSLKVMTETGSAIATVLFV